MDGSKLTLGLLAVGALGAGWATGMALGSQARTRPPWTEVESCVTCGKEGPLVASGFVTHGMVCPSCAVRQSDRPDYLARARGVQKQARVPFRDLTNEAYRTQRQDKSWVTKSVCATCGRPPPLQASVLQPREMLCTACAEKEERSPSYKRAVRQRRLEYGVGFPRDRSVGPLSQAEQQAARVRRQTSLEKRDPPKAKPSLFSSIKGGFSVGERVRFRASYLESAPSWSLPRGPDGVALTRGVVARLIPRPGLPMLLEVIFSSTQTMPFPASAFESDKGGSPARPSFEVGDLVVLRGQVPTPGSVGLVLRVKQGLFRPEEISVQWVFSPGVYALEPDEIDVAQAGDASTRAEAQSRVRTQLL